jgi:hypothetical protein
MVYVPDQRIVIMDLASIERCGFQTHLFESELRTQGVIQFPDEAARWPVALVVNISGSIHDVRPDVPPALLERQAADRVAFEQIITAICGAAPQ